jgi:hypothetical protein
VVTERNEINGDEVKPADNKKKEYPKDRIKELAMNSKNKNIRELHR